MESLFILAKWTAIIGFITSLLITITCSALSRTTNNKKRHFKFQTGIMSFMLSTSVFLIAIIILLISTVSKNIPWLRTIFTIVITLIDVAGIIVIVKLNVLDKILGQQRS